MAESSLSQRRQALPFEVFAELLRRVLRPIAQAGAGGCFGRWRLTAIDGVSFSLANTDQLKAKCPKGANQYGPVAFAKLQCAALVELGAHNPLAAALADERGQSEWSLALGLLAHLPRECLLLADRLYGCGAFLLAAAQQLNPLDGRFLVRAKEKHKVEHRGQRFADGSQEVWVLVLDPADHHRAIAAVRVRQVVALIQRPGHRPVRLRLWTNLSCAEATAEQLVGLYVTRWEQELYFRELKWHLGINDLLRSQTLETAVQEVAAMIIGTSLVAHQRASLKPGEELSQRISFIKTWETLEPLWLTLMLGADILSPEQKQQLCDRFYLLASRRVMAKKRNRSCPRVMRQPAQPWPRKRHQQSCQGPAEISIDSTCGE